MVVFGLVLLGAALLAANWRHDQPVLLPGKRTTTVKPGVIIVLADLGLLFLFGGCSGTSPSEARPERVHSTALQEPSQHWLQEAKGAPTGGPCISHDFLKRIEEAKR